MYRKYVYSGITWYDFRQATESELVDICSLYDLSPEVIKKIVNTNHTNQIVEFPHCLLVSLDIPCSIDTSTSKKIKDKPIDFVLGRDFILTARHDEVRGFADAKKELRGSKSGQFPLLMIQTVMSHVYGYIRDDLRDHLRHASRNHHSYALKKYLKDYEKTLKKHRKELKVFSAIALEFFNNPETQMHLDSIMEQFNSTYILVKEERVRQKNKKSKVENKDKTSLWNKILAMVNGKKT